MRCNPVTFVGLLFFAPILVFGQGGNYVIKGKIGTINPPVKVFLTYMDVQGRKTTTDSAEVKNGAFEFKGTVKEPLQASLVLDHTGTGLKPFEEGVKQDVLGIYIEKGVISVTGSDSLYNATISGSKLNADAHELNKLLMPGLEKGMALNTEWQMASAEKQASVAFSSSVQQRYLEIQQEQKAVL